MGRKGEALKAVVSGQGLPVLLLHEWLGDHRNWVPLLDRARGAPVQWHCIDLPGYGLSAHMDPVPDAQMLAQMVLDYADAQSLQRFGIVGHSMSGLIAYWLNRLAAARIVDTVYVCPVPPCGFQASRDVAEWLRTMAADKSGLRDAILMRGGAIEEDAWVDRKVRIAWEACRPRVRQVYLDMFLAPLHVDAEALKLEKGLVVTGSHDLPFYQEASLRRELAGYFSSLEVFNIAGSGHYPMLQAPDRFLSFLLTKLDHGDP